MEIEISIENVIENVTETLRYYSGKHAEKPEDFFRYGACGADRPMLIRLLGEGAAWIGARVGQRLERYENDGSALAFEFRTGRAAIGKETILKTLLTRILERRIIYGWLLLAGASPALQRDEESELMAASFLELVKAGGDGGEGSEGCFTRWVPPI